MTGVFEILKGLPRTNCGECGRPTCLAFATEVWAGRASLDACPYAAGREALRPRAPVLGEEAALDEAARRVRGMDLGLAARALGGTPHPKGLELTYFGRPVVITREGEWISSLELDPRDRILLFNYVLSGGGVRPSGEWVGLEAFPSSMSKVKTLRRYTEERLAAAFSGRAEALVERAASLGGRPLKKGAPADVVFELSVLPLLALRIQFWDEDPEDGLPADAKVLYDSRAVELLDLESLVFAAERAVELLTEG